MDYYLYPELPQKIEMHCTISEVADHLAYKGIVLYHRSNFINEQGHLPYKGIVLYHSSIKYTCHEVLCYIIAVQGLVHSNSSCDYWRYLTTFNHVFLNAKNVSKHHSWLLGMKIIPGKE